MQPRAHPLPQPLTAGKEGDTDAGEAMAEDEVTSAGDMTGAMEAPQLQRPILKDTLQK